MTFVETPFDLAIDRPEYFQMVDALVSDVVWRALGEATDDASVRTARRLVFELAPNVSEDRLTNRRGQQLGRLIRATGSNSTLALEVSKSVSSLFGINIDERLSQSVLDALKGVRPTKSDVQPAGLAFWPAIFLQGLDGVLRKTGPSNYFNILSTLYLWGDCGVESRPQEGVRRLVGALLSVPERDPTKRLGEAIATGIETWAQSFSHDDPIHHLKSLKKHRANLLAWSLDQTVQRTPQVLPIAFDGLEHTPFVWFRQALDRLCTPTWRDALPARRWSDWLSCVLRTGIGLGYLFEARYYRRLGQAMLRQDLSKAERWTLLRQQLQQPLLNWSSAQAALSERNVSGRIREWCSSGDAVRLWMKDRRHDVQSFEDTVEVDGSAVETLEAYCTALGRSRESDAWRDELRAVLSQRPESSNLEETVKASLLSRERHSEDADLYSLLMPRANNRLSIVEPAEEWIVVIAALSTTGPGASGTLGELRRSLRMLGVDAARQTVVDELERVGLTQSAHDADDALEVGPAF